jgi:hypothetical protein
VLWANTDGHTAGWQNHLEGKISRLNLTGQTLLKTSHCPIRFELLQLKLTLTFSDRPKSAVQPKFQILSIPSTAIYFISVLC